MNNFVFCNPTRLILGKGQIAALKDQVSKYSKVLMIYGGGSIKSNGVYDQVTEALKQSGVQYIEFSGVEPNPKYETLMKAVELARKENVDFLLAVGGGSIIDGTKFIAVAINYTKGDPWNFILDQREVPSLPRVPFGTVLTLPATASEMNNGAVISRLSSEEKFAFHHPDNYPVFSILDPMVCYSLPPRQIANGIVDIFVHVLEQYLTYPSKSYIQERFAEGVLCTLREIAPRLVAGEKDYDLFANFMLSATMGLNGFISMGVPQDWATHMIGHELTAIYGMDHGRTLAVVGPSLMDVMRDEKKEMLLQYGERVWDIKEGSEQERIDKAIALTREFYEKAGVRTHLSEYGVNMSRTDEIVERFRRRGTVLGERGTITPDVVKRILDQCK